MKFIPTKGPWDYRTWDVYIGDERMYVATYHNRISEASVLANVRHTYGNKDITIKLQS